MDSEVRVWVRVWVWFGFRFSRKPYYCNSIGTALERLRNSIQMQYNLMQFNPDSIEIPLDAFLARFIALRAGAESPGVWGACALLQ
eukprot:6365518-Pyramimonas_sp.AAC.1